MPLKSYQGLSVGLHLPTVPVHVAQRRRLLWFHCDRWGDRVTRKRVSGSQMVCRARQRHVESTLKAQQLITCMSYILGGFRHTCLP